MVLDAYSEYVNNFSTAMAVVRKTCASKPGFLEFLKVWENCTLLCHGYCSYIGINFPKKTCIFLHSCVTFILGCFKRKSFWVLVLSSQVKWLLFCCLLGGFHITYKACKIIFSQTCTMNILNHIRICMGNTTLRHASRIIGRTPLPIARFSSLWTGSSVHSSNLSSHQQHRQETSSDRMTLYGLMMKPIQRFPQFILLLQV